MFEPKPKHMRRLTRREHAAAERALRRAARRPRGLSPYRAHRWVPARARSTANRQDVDRGA